MRFSCDLGVLSLLKRAGEDAYAQYLRLHMVEFIEREVALWSHAFQNHCELCIYLQRRHGNVGEAGHGPLASRARQVRNTVGGLAVRL